MKIIVDSREQRPFTFETLGNVQTVPGALQSGDYSLPGLEAEVAVERKSLADLLMCLGTERDRFQRELERARGLRAFMVVVESGFGDIVAGKFRSRISPKAAVSSIMAFQARYGIPFFFAGGRPAAERATAAFLWTYATGLETRLKAVEKALERNREEGPGEWLSTREIASQRNKEPIQKKVAKVEPAIYVPPPNPAPPLLDIGGAANG